MKTLVVALALLTLTGCTMASLRRQTLSQVNSSVDLRLSETLDNLALFADDPAGLPAYASIFSGTATVTDTGTFGGTTIWQHLKGANGFASQTASAGLMRQIGENWTVDPIVDPERLEVVRYACLWVVHGPQLVDDRGISLLARPDQVPRVPGRHFGVLDRMNRLPGGWLGRGQLHEVPRCAVYRAHHGGTWVWVVAEGVRGLSDFSLVIQDIARVNINSTTLFNPVPMPAQWTFNAVDNNRVAITVVVDSEGRLAPDTADYRQRLDSLGNDPTFRSQIIASGSH